MHIVIRPMDIKPRIIFVRFVIVFVVLVLIPKTWLNHPIEIKKANYQIVRFDEIIIVRLEELICASSGLL